MTSRHSFINRVLLCTTASAHSLTWLATQKTSVNTTVEMPDGFTHITAYSFFDDGVPSPFQQPRGPPTITTRVTVQHHPMCPSPKMSGLAMPPRIRSPRT